MSGAIKNRKSHNFTFQNIQLKKKINNLKISFFLLAIILIFSFYFSLGNVYATDIDTVTYSENAPNNDSNDTQENNTDSAITLSKDQILDAGKNIADYMEKNKWLPNQFIVGNQEISMGQYLYAASSVITGSKMVVLIDVNDSGLWIFRLSSTFTSSEYLDISKRTLSFISTNKKIPNYVSTSIGKVDYFNLIYIQSKILRFIKINGRLPNSVSLTTPVPNNAYKINSATVDSKISSLQSQLNTIKSTMNTLANKIKITTNPTTLKTLQSQYNTLAIKYKDLNSELNYYITLRNSPWYVPSSVRNYLKETIYAQLSNPNVVYLAQNLSAATPYETANNIFVWVRDNLKYEFYYKTKYGAAGALKGLSGNCVDHSHLLVALSRSAGLPARYVRGYCQFLSGNYYSHVWAQIWVKNYGWLNADATHYINELGSIKSWNATKSTIYGTLLEYSL